MPVPILCIKFPETMKHLFFDCEFTHPIWTEFEAWWKGLSKEDINLSFQSIIFGHNPRLTIKSVHSVD